MKRNSPLQDRYPNRDGIFTELRKLSAADIEAQVRYLMQRADQHQLHAQALIAYRDRVFNKPRYGR